MLKNISAFLLLFATLNFAQDKLQHVFIEHNSLITSPDQQTEVISYKVPYKNLLFKKTNSNYSTAFSLVIEIFNEQEFVVREIVKASFSVSSYEETISKKNYYNDFIEIKIDSGNYIIKSVFNIEGTDIEFKLPDVNIEINNLFRSKIIPPIIVNNPYAKNFKYELTNFGGKLPFSPEKYDLLFGILDKNIKSVAVTVSQFNKTVISDTLNTLTKGFINLRNDENSLALTVSDSSDVSYFLLSDFSNLLYEGTADIIISLDSNEKKIPINILWINKPSILNNPEYAVKLLSYIESDDVVGNLLSLSKDQYYKSLTEYWISNYPSNSMKYNYAMEEYYSRADYAVKNYSSLNAYDGAERDRGRIYILYGKPDSVDRNYSEMNEVLEVWNYEKIGRRFVFKDINGTGKFDLVE